MSDTNAANIANIAIRAVFRVEHAKLVARLARMVRDVGVAEELAQDALVAALETWPRDGVPANPAAWLMTTAKRRALNTLNRGRMVERKHEELGHMTTTHEDPADLDDDVGDDLLRLMFVSCHPVLAPEARVALTLRLLGGLTTDEIARAFLVAEPTVAQRIVRAKRALAEAKVAFEVPPAAERAARLASVCAVIYLVFNEGYAASAGDDPMRPALLEDALRLGRVLAGLVPDEPEVHGLCALMELHASRAGARIDANGESVLLLEQNRARWDQRLIRRGLEALAHAEQLAGAGPYVVQAKISACHARAVNAADTDWPRIAALYTELLALQPTPVVELNRAMAIAMAEGPAAGLALIDDIAPRLARYPWLAAARADLLVKLDRRDEARSELARAAELTTNTHDRAKLLRRAAAL
ncbi:MAG TPA: sigma-70 family RNA polymerase sigma factor [Kofleriaceae bacterium]